MPKLPKPNQTTLSFSITEVDPVTIFGTEDSLLRSVEASHPDVNVLVRGNEVTLTGSESEVFAAKKLIDESGLNVHSAVLLQEAADKVKEVLA